jgi:hypothetical protein
MLRPDDQGRTTFAGDARSAPGGSASVRQSAAHSATVALRLIAAPFFGVAAALAGLLFAALLPICGIATISEGIAKAAWRFVRETFAQLPKRQPHRI